MIMAYQGGLVNIERLSLNLRIAMLYSPSYDQGNKSSLSTYQPSFNRGGFPFLSRLGHAVKLPISLSSRPQNT
jgi:3-deoxy-D-manno-octulosonic acid (KDO) 8-phosphate synthase